MPPGIERRRIKPKSEDGKKKRIKGARKY